MIAGSDFQNFPCSDANNLSITVIIVIRLFLTKLLQNLALKLAVTNDVSSFSVFCICVNYK